MKIYPVGTSLLIELVDFEHKEGIIVSSASSPTQTAKVLDLSSELKKHAPFWEGMQVLFVGNHVVTPIPGQFIIDAEQVIGWIKNDEESS
jgi:hypothetical protein